jgi:hypothetical protein
MGAMTNWSSCQLRHVVRSIHVVAHFVRSQVFMMLFQALPPTPVGATKFLTVDIGEFVINSLLYHAWDDGYLKVTLYSDDPVRRADV